MNKWLITTRAKALFLIIMIYFNINHCRKEWCGEERKKNEAVFLNSWVVDITYPVVGLTPEQRLRGHACLPIKVYRRRGERLEKHFIYPGHPKAR